MGGGMGQKIGVQVLFRNISLELDRLAQVADNIDERIGDLASDASDMTRTVSANLQDIDALKQALVAMSRITHSAANEVPDDTEASLDTSALAAGVTLEKTRNACLQLHRAPASQSEQGRSDIVTFFLDEL